MISIDKIAIQQSTKFCLWCGHEVDGETTTVSHPEREPTALTWKDDKQEDERNLSSTPKEATDDETPNESDDPRESSINLHRPPGNAHMDRETEGRISGEPIDREPEFEDRFIKLANEIEWRRRFDFHESRERFFALTPDNQRKYYDGTPREWLRKFIRMSSVDVDADELSDRAFDVGSIPDAPRGDSSFEEQDTSEEIEFDPDLMSTIDTGEQSDEE